MAWENQNPTDKNLEALRQSFSLENIIGAKVMTSPPEDKDIGEGQLRLVRDGTDLYLYTKDNGVIKSLKFS